MTMPAEHGAERLELVDALRGFALFGLLIVHMVELFELYWIEPHPDVWFDWVFAIFSSKSFAIFALLFGFSFATIMGNQRSRGIDFTARFAWRLTLLFVIGTLHTLVYRGDILQVLAVMGFLLIPLDRVRSPRILLVLAALFFLQIPLLLQSWLAAEGVPAAQQPPFFFSDTGLVAIAEASLGQVFAINLGPGMAAKWSFYLSSGRASQIAGLFVIGMLLQRHGAFARVETKRGGWAWALAVSGIAWLLLDRFGDLIIPAQPDQGGAPMQAQAMIWALDNWKAAALTAFQVAGFVFLWQWPTRVILRWFAPPGRMTLTLYVFQSCVMVPVLFGFGLGLWDEVSSKEMVIAGLAFFALQIVLAAWWFRHFRYGPLEWIWRAATLTTRSVPMRRSGR